MVELSAVLIGTILGWVLALVTEPIRRAVYGPKLRIECDPLNGTDCVEIDAFVTGVSPEPLKMRSFWLRVRVRNVGQSTAEQVEVVAKSLHRRSAEGYKRDLGFMPLNLKWSHIGEPYYPLIPPGVSRHLDVLCIREPTEARELALHHRNLPEKTSVFHQPGNVIEVQTWVRPNTGCDIVAPGDYKVELVAVARNALPVVCAVYVQIKPEWVSGHMKEQVTVSGLPSGDA